MARDKNQQYYALVTLLYFTFIFLQANSIACSTDGSALPQIHVNENGKGLFFLDIYGAIHKRRRNFFGRF